MDVKAGDVVRLKPMRVTKVLNEDAILLDACRPGFQGLYMLAHYIESIERPETDWSKVPRGTRVRVRDNQFDPWSDAIYIGRQPRNMGGLHLVFKQGASYATPEVYCELVGEA